jgi:hypothetical protein
LNNADAAIRIPIPTTVYCIAAIRLASFAIAYGLLTFTNVQFHCHVTHSFIISNNPRLFYKLVGLLLSVAALGLQLGGDSEWNCQLWALNRCGERISKCEQWVGGNPFMTSTRKLWPTSLPQCERPQSGLGRRNGPKTPVTLPPQLSSSINVS